MFYATGPCTHCGYDLRSHCMDDTCPECGRPALDSTPKWPLSDDTRKGLRTRLRGATALLLAGTLLAIGVALLLASAFLTGGVALLSLAGTLAGLLVTVLGVSWIAHESTEAPRARSSSVSNAAALVLIVLVVSVPPLFGASWPPAIALVWLGCVIACSTAAMIATTLLLASIARRIPNRRSITAARRASVWARITAATLVLAPFAVWALTALLLARSSDTSGYGGLAAFLGAMFIVGLPLLILALITAVTYFVALARIRRALAQLLDDAD